MSRRLDETVPELRILEAVRPLFSSPLPWSLSGPRRSDDEDAETEIRAEAAGTFFLYEMATMEESLLKLPNRELSQKSFEGCLEAISDLLQFLEDLVHEDILEHRLAIVGETTADVS